MTLFGAALIVVAVIPKQRSASLGAALLHIISYFLVYAINGSQVPAWIKLLLSVIPNVAMYFTLETAFYYEVWGSGINSGSANSWHNNYLFSGGLCMLAFDFVYMMFLGYYLDQVLPSEYGVVRKWNFCCKKDYWKKLCSKKPKSQINIE